MCESSKAVTMDCSTRTSCGASTSGRPANGHAIFRLLNAAPRLQHALKFASSRSLGRTRHLARSGRSAGKGAQQLRPGSGPKLHCVASAETYLDAEPQKQRSIAWRTEYDGLIIGLAVPALGSILLDPIMSLVDTGDECTQNHCCTGDTNSYKASLD